MFSSRSAGLIVILRRGALGLAGSWLSDIGHVLTRAKCRRADIDVSSVNVIGCRGAHLFGETRRGHEQDDADVCHMQNPERPTRNGLSQRTFLLCKSPGDGCVGGGADASRRSGCASYEVLRGTAIILCKSASVLPPLTTAQLQPGSRWNGTEIPA